MLTDIHLGDDTGVIQRWHSCKRNICSFCFKAVGAVEPERPAHSTDSDGAFVSHTHELLRVGNLNVHRFSFVPSLRSVGVISDADLYPK